jgi:hypothetical protein
MQCHPTIRLVALAIVPLVAACGPRATPPPEHQVAGHSTPLAEVAAYAELLECARSQAEALIAVWQTAKATDDEAALTVFAGSHGHETLLWLDIHAAATMELAQHGMSAIEAVDASPQTLLADPQTLAAMRRLTNSLPLATRRLASPHELAQLRMAVLQSRETANSPRVTARDVLNACESSLTPAQINHMLSNGPFVRSTLFGVDQ